MITHLTLDESRQAVRLGVAHAMSDCGLTPSQAEQKLAEFFTKRANPLAAIGDLIEKYGLAWVAGGAALGAYAGRVHHKMDQTMAGTDDPQLNTLRKKTDGYHKMTADLRQTQMAGQPL